MVQYACKDNQLDDHVDVEIINCLNLENPKSFFLFAGAGSGKTSSLVKALNDFRAKNYRQLQLTGQRVGVITYTNVACEEISRRLGYDALFAVSTIHTFVWELIKGFDKDIKEWLNNNLTIQINELETKIANGRIGTKIYYDRQNSIEAKKKRIENLKRIKKFTYNPNGLNQDKESLGHNEVISIGANFLISKPLMQKILVQKYPVLLIDESQDTNKDLIDAMFAVEAKNSNVFSLGLFGDTMQRIYSDGKVDLGINLPEGWAKPVKKMNHRCPARVIKLINQIRLNIDNQEQRARTDKEQGFVRFFILSTTAEKAKVEKIVTERMSEITGDHQWAGNEAEYTTLILEHHMAATRLGFWEMFQPLYKVEKLKSGLLDGSLSGLKFFTEIILPVVNANKIGDKLAIAGIVRKYSPLLKIQKHETDQLSQLKNAQEAVRQLLLLWNMEEEPRCIDILQCVKKTNLFNIPDSLYPFVNRDQPDQNIDDDEQNIENDVLSAWDKSLNAPFSQIITYNSYITGKLNYMTHQGVKGLEFPRVMVIIDDSEARGFLFSYEKLFGAKEKTGADLENEKAGNDTSIDRTRRLFYVTCSRAEKSLAIVAYSNKPEKVKEHVLKEGWFEDSEIEMIP